MAIKVLFIQGGGEGAYAADERLAQSLRDHLEAGAVVRYPKMPDEAEPDYETWRAIIADELAALGEGAILAGHSIGASVIIRAAVDGVGASAAGVFLMSAPFWYDHDFWCWKDVELPVDAAARLPPGLPVFLYHGREDESVPVAHVEMYARALPQATVRRLDGRNHQLDDDLQVVVQDILSLT